VEFIQTYLLLNIPLGRKGDIFVLTRLRSIIVMEGILYNEKGKISESKFE
jgi:hypothetical protein